DVFYFANDWLTSFYNSPYFLSFDKIGVFMIFRQLKMRHPQTWGRRISFFNRLTCSLALPW
ncbi:hypothetical protein, partial [Limosilactobacillus fermentum]|uniref:hypothetical protein n=1 Tax=Limosilactobacillus fermentum TaxID=1613 RepID=UPI001C660DF8